MIDPRRLKDARAVAAAMQDQALAALTEPARASRLITLSAAVRANHNELAEALGSREQAAIVLLGMLGAVVIDGIGEQEWPAQP